MLGVGTGVLFCKDLKLLCKINFINKFCSYGV